MRLEKEGEEASGTRPKPMKKRPPFLPGRLTEPKRSESKVLARNHHPTDGAGEYDQYRICFSVVGKVRQLSYFISLFFFETVRHQEGGRLEHIRDRADGQKSET